MTKKDMTSPEEVEKLVATLEETNNWETEDHIKLANKVAATLRALTAERDVLQEGIFDALGRYQVTHIHAALRNAMSNVERRS